MVIYGKQAFLLIVFPSSGRILVVITLGQGYATGKDGYRSRMLLIVP
jgi:hypothetical protein